MCSRSRGELIITLSLGVKGLKSSLYGSFINIHAEFFPQNYCCGEFVGTNLHTGFLSYSMAACHTLFGLLL